MLHIVNIAKYIMIKDINILNFILKQNPNFSLSATSVVGQMSAKTTYHKSALGPISISNCTPDGKLVELENTGTRVSILFTDFVY